MWGDGEKLNRIIHLLEEIEFEVRHSRKILERIEGALIPSTPTSVCLRRTSMLPADPGNTLVYTGTIAPVGAAFPSGTTFTVTSSDPTVTPTLDSTGLIVTVPLPSTVTVGETLTITWATSTFVPEPAGSPASLTETITIVIGAPPVATPTGVSFAQTT